MTRITTVNTNSNNNMIEVCVSVLLHMSKVYFVRTPRDIALLVRSARKSETTSSCGHNVHSTRITM
jgi:hypothetical protein